MPSPRLDLLVVADHFRGGLGAAAQAHARWFAERGWSVALAADAPVADEIAPARAVQVSVPGGAADLVGMVSAARQLRAVLRLERPRVVHAHGTRSQMLSLLAGRVPYVTMHGAGGRVEGQGRVGAALRHGSRVAASWLAVSAYSASPAPGRWRTTLHASPRLDSVGRLAAAEMTHEPTLLWVGRLDAPKLPEVFVEACALASQERSLRGVMLGDGPRLAEMRALAARLDAPVDVLGETPDVAGHLARSWAVCLFSGFEGVPFAVQEAMWAGRAVVLSSLPSLTWFAADAAIYADDAAGAAAAIIGLCDRDVAVDRGDVAADRARNLLALDAPFAQLRDDYAARR